MKNNRNFHGWNSPEPIGLEYIAAALSVAGFHCDFKSQYELQVTSSSRRYFISLISAMTCEFTEVLQIAQRAKNNGAITILGGYHACGNCENIKDECFDHIVVGEGEEISVMLARVLLNNESVEFYGNSYTPENLPGIIHAPPIADINLLPFPARSQERLGTYILFDLMWPPNSLQSSTAIVLTSRGCQHSCDFCASATVWGNKIRHRTTENIISELKELKNRFNTNTIIIVDQSFGQNRKWTLAVCKAIKEANLELNWYHQSNLTVSKDLIKAMAEAGCTKIGFGVEGISPQAARIVKPIHPDRSEYINDLFAYCNSLGIFVKAYLMLGFPWETDDIVAEYFASVKTLRANQIKISYITPFPGTNYWEQYSDRLITKDWKDFDTVSMPVIRNHNISVSRYHEIRQELFKTFYSSKVYASGVERMLNAYPHYRQSYIEFCQYLEANDMITGNETWLDMVKSNALMKTK